MNNLHNTALTSFSSLLWEKSQWVYVKGSISVETPLHCGVLQGSVLGPLLFSLYTKQLSDLIHNFSIDQHFFANDSELYYFIPAEHDSALTAIRNVERCCLEIKKWMNQNKLKLNEQKTEALLCGPPSRRESVPVSCLLIMMHTSWCTHSVFDCWTLGVLLESDLSFEQQVSSLVMSCFPMWKYCVYSASLPHFQRC